MSRIDIGEIQDFAFQLRAANQTGRKIIQGVKTTVTNYVEDGSLKGEGRGSVQKLLSNDIHSTLRHDNRGNE